MTNQRKVNLPRRCLVEPQRENNIDFHYGQIIEQALTKPQVYNTGVGNRYVSNWIYRIPGDDWTRGIKLSVGDLGYKGDRAKMQQLCRNYYTPETVAEARDKLQARLVRKMDLSSVGIHKIDFDLDMDLALDCGEVDSDRDFVSSAFSTGGPSKKRKASMGPCMVAITATHIKKANNGKSVTSVSVFYRSTEVVQKFGADLIFLHDIIFPALIPEEIMPITEVNFHFTNSYFSPAFIPVLYKYMSPIDVIKWLKPILYDPQNKGDLNLFKSCIRTSCLPLNFKLTDHAFRTRRVMQEQIYKVIGEDYDYGEFIKYINFIGYGYIIKDKTPMGEDE